MKFTNQNTNGSNSHKFFNTSNFIMGNTEKDADNENSPDSVKKLIIYNVEGNFIPNNKIIIDPNGLNILKSISKNGEYFLGKILKIVIILYINNIIQNDRLINDYLINPSKEYLSDRIISIVYDGSKFYNFYSAKSFLICDQR